MITKTGLLEVYIRMTKQERKDIKEIAKLHNIDMGDWLREAIGCKLDSEGYDGAVFFAPPVSQSE